MGATSSPPGRTSAKAMRPRAHQDGRLGSPTAEAEHKMERRLLLNVVIREGATILQLLAREDQTLLVGRNALLVLDFRLHIFDGIAGLDLQSDRLAGQRLDKDLH